MLLDFRFTPAQRKALADCLAAAGVAPAAIGDVECTANIFRALLSSPGPTRASAERLRRLAGAAERFRAALAALDNDGRDMLRAQAMLRLGAAASFLRQLAADHRVLEGALALVDRDRGSRFAKPGRPGEQARAWLLGELPAILARHRRPARRKVLEALARHGVIAPATSQDLPLEPCARIVLEAVGETVPAALGKLVRRAVKNLPQKP